MLGAGMEDREQFCTHVIVQISVDLLAFLLCMVVEGKGMVFCIALLQ